MRPIVLAALLVAAPLLPAAPAAAEGPLLSDEPGDTRLRTVEGTEAPFSGNDQAAAVDLVSLALQETDDDVSFVLGVAGGLDQPLVGASYAVRFAWDGSAMALLIGYFRFDGPFGGAFSQAELQVEGEDGMDSVYWTRAVVDPAASTLTVTLPKVYVMDADQRPPGRGDVLADLRAESERPLDGGFAPFGWLVGGGPSPRVVDEMGADAPAAFAFQRGDYARGDVLVSSPDRVRVSNGGATTFVYRVDVRNAGATDAEYALGIEGTPPGWNATVQTPLRVPAGETRRVAVLASVPFAHDHGGFTAFNLTVRSASDPATEARMRLGVLHTPVPQPAGHHDELFLHAPGRSSDPVEAQLRSLFSTSVGYMNTLDDHTGDAEDLGPTWGGTEAAWYVPLRPRLQMGLDFDLDRAGTLDGALVGRADGEHRLRAELWYAREGEDDGLLLAESDEATVQVTRDAQAPFQLTLTPAEDADYVPYDQDQYLYLLLWSTQAGGEASLDFGPFDDALLPRLSVPAFKLKLPLDEYHDRLTGASEAATALDLVPDGPVQKSARPGSTVTYAFDLRNGGNASGVFTVDVAGNDAGLARLVPAEPFELAAGATRRVTLAVSVPPEAEEGQEIEVLAFAYAEADPSLTAIGRTKTTVTRGGEAVPDESGVFLAAQEAERDAPGAGLAALAAAAAVAALLARRR